MIRKLLKALLKVLLFFKVSDFTRLASIRRCRAPERRRHGPGLCAQPVSSLLSLNKPGNIWLSGSCFFPQMASSVCVDLSKSSITGRSSAFSSLFFNRSVAPSPYHALSTSISRSFPWVSPSVVTFSPLLFRSLVNEMPGSRGQVFCRIRSPAVRAARPLGARQDRQKWDETIYRRWIAASVV